MSNLTYSIKKDRELSVFEARLVSFRRRLSDPLGRSSKKQVARAYPVPRRQRGLGAEMGKKKRRNQVAVDWYSSVTDESDTKPAGSHNITGPHIIVAEDDQNNNHMQTDNQNSSGQSRNGNRASPSHQTHKATLGPWTQAVSDVVEEMGAAQQAIGTLKEMFSRHMDDLSMLEETKARLEQAIDEGREKDDELQRRENTIRTLTSMDERSKAELKKKHEMLDAEKLGLEQDKKKMEARIAMETAEERHRIARDFDELISKQNKTYETRMKELQAEYDRKSNENSTKVMALEAENGRLLTRTKQQDNLIKGQEIELGKYKDLNDILERAKNSLRDEKEKLEAHLGKMKEDFALTTEPVEYFEHEFADVYGQISEISQKYFHNIDGEDLEKIHKELATADPHFKSVPIDVSEDSRDLRAAHAQRIISKAIYEDIWQPFSSESALRHPGLSDWLSKISNSLDRNGQGGDVAKVWTALTIRALQSLQDDTVVLEARESNDTSTIRPTRVDHVISKVFRVLSPLVNLSQAEGLRTDLHAVVKSASTVWNKSQAGGLKITIDTHLDRAQREEWRSQPFDPATTAEADEPDPDLVSRTHPRIFTLFPRISAQIPIQEKLLPGSWPMSTPTVIHPGAGLPEWSFLVVRGKRDQEEKEESLRLVYEDYMKERSMRLSGHARKGSKATSITGPPSPTALWRTGGSMNEGSRTEFE